MLIDPRLVRMPPADVVYTSLPIRRRPNDGKVAVRPPLPILLRQARRIEPHDDVDLVARVRLFEYWVLVAQHERRSSPCVGAWKFLVLDDDPRVGVELAVHVAAYHLTKLGPGRESHARCMTDDQPLAVVVHEGQKIFLLLIRQHTVAGG